MAREEFSIGFVTFNVAEEFDTAVEYCVAEQLEIQTNSDSIHFFSATEFYQSIKKWATFNAHVFIIHEIVDGGARYLKCIL